MTDSQLQKLVGAVVVAGAAIGVRTVILSKGKKALEPWGPRWLAIGLSNFLGKAANAAGVQFASDTCEKFHEDPAKRLDPKRQYFCCWHPHGAFTFCAAAFTSNMTALSTTSSAPGPENWFIGIADLLFRFPVVGEFLALMNARPVTERMTKEILQKGHSFGLQPGGIAEQVRTDHRRELLVFPPQLGFCRLAIKYGTPLVPIYAFGENQVFSTSEWGRRTTLKLHDKFGIAVPLVNPLPNNVTIHMKWGQPVEVGEKQQDPKESQVQQTFARYVLELGRLFEEHRYQVLPPDVAAKGLTVMWRGNSKEALEKLLIEETHEGRLPACLQILSGLAKPEAPILSKL